MKNNSWLKIGALAAGLVGVTVAAAVVVKKKLHKDSEQVMFDSYDDDWSDELDVASEPTPVMAAEDAVVEEVAEQVVVETEEVAEETIEEAPEAATEEGVEKVTAPDSEEADEETL